MLIEEIKNALYKSCEKIFSRKYYFLKSVHLEEAWGILRNKGYQNQFEVMLSWT